MTRHRLATILTLLTLAAAAGVHGGGRGGAAGAAAAYQSPPPPKPIYVLAKPENFSIESFPGLMDGVKYQLIRSFSIDSQRVEIRKSLDPDASDRCARIGPACDTVKLIKLSDCNQPGQICNFQVVVNCWYYKWENRPVFAGRKGLDYAIARAIKLHEIKASKAHERKH